MINYNEIWIQLVVRTSKTSITSGRNQIYQIRREKVCCNIWYWRVLLCLVKTNWNWKPNPKLCSYWKFILLFLSLIPKGSSFSKWGFLFWYKLHVPLMIYTRAICFLTYKDPFEAFSQSNMETSSPTHTASTTLTGTAEWEPSRNPPNSREQKC